MRSAESNRRRRGLAAIWVALTVLVLVGFVGLGWANGENASEGDAGPHPAGGGGISYLLAKKMGMHAGIDVARGPEETAFYIQVGSAW